MSKDFNLMNIEDITKLGTVTENSNERYTYNGISVPRVTSIIRSEEHTSELQSPG